MIHPGYFTVVNIHFDDVETPRQIARSKLFQPGIRPALDQSLFRFVHGVQGADRSAFSSGFDFNEDERVVGIPGNNIELTVFPAPVSCCNFPSFTFNALTK